MRSLIKIFTISSLLLVSCSNEDDRFKSQLVNITFLQKTNDIPKYINVSRPTVIKFFNSKLDTLYDRDIQKYHNLSDFIGYYSVMCQPILDKFKIESIQGKSEIYCFNLTSGKKLFLDGKSFKNKQGLIIFNQYQAPVYWLGNTSEKLDTYFSKVFSKNNDSITQK